MISFKFQHKKRRWQMGYCALTKENISSVGFIKRKLVRHCRGKISSILEAFMCFSIPVWYGSTNHTLLLISSTLQIRAWFLLKILLLLLLPPNLLFDSD